MNSPSKVYRQLILGGDPLWYDSSKSPPISHAAFLPSSEDTDGLSLIDTSLRSVVWAAHRVEAPKTQRRVAELDVSEIERIATEFNLSHELICDQDELDKLFGEPIAHCLATYINRSDYDSKKEAKKKMKSWAKTVASKIANENISEVQPLPSIHHCYRPPHFKFGSRRKALLEIAIRLKLLTFRAMKGLKRPFSNG